MKLHEIRAQLDMDEIIRECEREELPRLREENLRLRQRVDELEKIITGDPAENGEKDGLVYAVENRIYLMIFGREKDILIAERDALVRAICSDGENLYDGGNYGKIFSAGDYGKVFDTLTGRMIARRWCDSVNALCWHAGRLYDGGDSKVYETVTGKKVAKRGGPIKDIFVYNGAMYDVYYDKSCSPTAISLNQTFTDKHVGTARNRRSSENFLSRVCSYDRKIHLSGVSDTNIDLDWFILNSKGGNILSLCPHNGRLYYSTDQKGIYRYSAEGEEFIKNVTASALCSASPKLIEKILAKSGK